MGQGLRSIGEITDGCNEVKSKPKASTFIAVRFFKDTKDFDFSDNVFNRDTQASKFTVRLFCSLTKGLLRQFMLGCKCIDMEGMKPLITSIT